MTDDRKTSVAPLRPDRAARSGLGRCKRSILAALCLLSSVLWPLSTACAAGIEVNKAEARLSDDSYQLSANFDISLNFVIEQALEQGIPLYFTTELTLTHPRWYWLDEVIAQSEQTTKLSYNSLTRQYRITLGSLFQNIASLDEALRIIGRQTAAPTAAALLKKDTDYVASVRMRLDVTQLPKPLQVNALAGSDWNLDSGWYRWIVRPDSTTRNARE